MQLRLTSSIRTHDHTVVQFPSLRSPEGHGGRLDGQQQEIADRAPLTSARRAVSSPTATHTTLDCADADHR